MKIEKVNDEGGSAPAPAQQVASEEASAGNEEEDFDYSDFEVDGDE